LRNGARRIRHRVSRIQQAQGRRRSAGLFVDPETVGVADVGTVRTRDDGRGGGDGSGERTNLKADRDRVKFCGAASRCQREADALRAHHNSSRGGDALVGCESYGCAGGCIKSKVGWKHDVHFTSGLTGRERTGGAGADFNGAGGVSRWISRTAKRIVKNRDAGAGESSRTNQNQSNNQRKRLSKIFHAMSLLTPQILIEAHP